ncbi:putative protein Hikeshi [Monocercomonoides exilis]|uniref:putative protein Hikeshi n=1 Tax=Monocercomonoides exilis TaxID=2049356 RepID=UPI00355AA18E|nr:putative protein Hikeshi [Monocercomonoides exilis]|eukprot:MONOS_7639.1-p1 / transcript=MONOS_7639.1 / gene=MONOS_7639 / organism=Monocercomonoides_exilis_PA203 / gene_product=unspecified product / transcript_product=unspecified product / location=Mono_scaffold00266:56640-57348(-) / protein_length=218 / sequence_SO=supercontig / SO=protein_coding / is_pseudo=false
MALLPQPSTFPVPDISVATAPVAAPSPTFCGVVLPKRPVITSFTALAPDKYIVPIEDISTASHVCIFLTGTPPLQSSLGCAIYLATTPFTQWSYLGSVHNQKPSTILRFRWPKDDIDRGVTAQLGINIVPIATVEELDAKKDAEKREVLSSSGDAALNAVGQKVVSNLYNFVTSMARTISFADGTEPVEVVPTAAITKWLETFNDRCRKNPNFWKDLL